MAACWENIQQEPSCLLPSHPGGQQTRCWMKVSHLYDVVVKQQPEAVALDDGDVVTSVRPAAADEEETQRNKTMLQMC